LAQATEHQGCGYTATLLRAGAPSVRRGTDRKSPDAAGVGQHNAAPPPQEVSGYPRKAAPGLGTIRGRRDYNKSAAADCQPHHRSGSIREARR